MRPHESLGSKVLFAIALVTIACFIGTSAFAGNSYDRKYDFNFKRNGETHGTMAREKQDATPTYIRIDSITLNSINLYVDGSKKQSGPWKNKTNRGRAVASRTGHFWIHNTVRESGMTWARLTGYATDGPGRIKGVWSPDSTGSYTSLN